MAKKVKIDGLADAVMKELDEYSKVIDEDMRKAVSKAGQTVRKEISANAPKRHGDYAKSWSTKKTRQTSRSLEVTVYSRNRYQLAHLLEHGHAKRNGGRTRAQVHIAPAEQNGIRQLEEDIKRSIRNG
jgi:HK97 gp10 family phage protein